MKFTEDLGNLVIKSYETNQVKTVTESEKNDSLHF